jgi:hypothetical protein
MATRHDQLSCATTQLAAVLLVTVRVDEGRVALWGGYGLAALQDASEIGNSPYSAVGVLIKYCDGA